MFVQYTVRSRDIFLICAYGYKNTNTNYSLKFSLIRRVRTAVPGYSTKKKKIKKNICHIYDTQQQNTNNTQYTQYIPNVYTRPRTTHTFSSQKRCRRACVIIRSSYSLLYLVYVFNPSRRRSDPYHATRRASAFRCGRSAAP